MKKSGKKIFPKLVSGDLKKYKTKILSNKKNIFPTKDEENFPIATFYEKYLFFTLNE